LRVIPFKILSIKELQLPSILEKISLEERGLILVTGTTGSGKSTTLAAMIDHINTNETNHIITVEDPIEFLIRDKRSIVNQREVGVDTMSFHLALKSALRQDPDVVLVGEMRDRDHRDRAAGRRDGPSGDVHAAHPRCRRDHQPHHLGLSPHQQKQVRIQLQRAQGGRLAAAGASRRWQGARRGGRDHEGHQSHQGAHRGQGPHQGDPRRDRRGNVSYGMQTFDQSLMQDWSAEPGHLPRGAPPGDQPRRLRAALPGHQLDL
jgi:twitching motility protein PilT